MPHVPPLANNGEEIASPTGAETMDAIGAGAVATDGIVTGVIAAVAATGTATGGVFVGPRMLVSSLSSSNTKGVGTGRADGKRELALEPWTTSLPSATIGVTLSMAVGSRAETGAASTPPPASDIRCFSQAVCLGGGKGGGNPLTCPDGSCGSIRGEDIVAKDANGICVSQGAVPHRFGEVRVRQLRAMKA